jgi:hypothetical protein
MFDISVVEILRNHRKWIESSKFAELVSEKRGVGVRQAYNLIKEAYDRKEILKIILPDRTVLYGLPEFGYPKFETSNTHNFTELFLFSCFRELEEINDMAIKDPIRSLMLLELLIKRLPPQLKEKIEPLLQRHHSKTDLINPVRCLAIIKDLTDKLSTLLHEYSDKM